MALEALWAPENLERVLGSPDLFRQLNRIYRRIPKTSCRRRAHCCQDCPPVYLVEYANMLQAAQEDGPEQYLQVVRRSLDYYFFSPVEPDLDCPFLVDLKCIIYAKRPRLCRVYGLYDPQEDLALSTRKLKQQVAARQNLLIQAYAAHNIEVRFRPALPLCPYVRSQNGAGVSLSRKARTASKQRVLELDDRAVGPRAGNRGQTLLPFSSHLAYSFFGPSRAQALQIGVLQTYQRNPNAARAQVRSLL